MNQNFTRMWGLDSIKMDGCLNMEHRRFTQLFTLGFYGISRVVRNLAQTFMIIKRKTSWSYEINRNTRKLRPDFQDYKK